MKDLCTKWKRAKLCDLAVGSSLLASHAPQQAQDYLTQVTGILDTLPGINAIDLDRSSAGSFVVGQITSLKVNSLSAADADILVDLLDANGHWLAGTRVSVKGGALRQTTVSLDLRSYTGPTGSQSMALKLVPAGQDYTHKLAESIRDGYIDQN